MRIDIDNLVVPDSDTVVSVIDHSRVFAHDNIV